MSDFSVNQEVVVEKDGVNFVGKILMKKITNGRLFFKIRYLHRTSRFDDWVIASNLQMAIPELVASCANLKDEEPVPIYAVRNKHDKLFDWQGKRFAEDTRYDFIVPCNLELDLRKLQSAIQPQQSTKRIIFCSSFPHTKSLKTIFSDFSKAHPKFSFVESSLKDYCNNLSTALLSNEEQNMLKNDDEIFVNLNGYYLARVLFYLPKLTRGVVLHVDIIPKIYSEFQAFVDFLASGNYFL